MMNPTRTQGTRRTGKNKADNGSKWIRSERRWGIYRRDEYCCIYCGKKMPHRFDGEKEVLDGSKFTLDHFRPVELGGSNDSGNLGTACKCCNSSKQAKSLGDFLVWLEETRGVDPAEIKARIRRNTRRKVKK